MRAGAWLVTSRVRHGKWETSVLLKGVSDTQFWLIGATEDLGPVGSEGLILQKSPNPDF